jgi:hypothetical protein
MLHKDYVKAIKRCILTALPPTGILHRATLINSAMTPFYNHVLMAFLATSKDFQHLHEEIIFYLLKKQSTQNFPQKEDW